MKTWLALHAHSFAIALDRLRRAPLASLISVLVIGTAIALPSGLYLLLDNLGKATADAAPRTELSVFFKLNTAEAAARQMGQGLQQQPEIASVRFIGRDEALRRLERLGLGDITAGLPGNPLPHALILGTQDSSPAALARLAETLRKRPEVDRVKLDSDWARRLNALMQLGERITWLLAGLFGLALAAITGNTIRLQIYAQRDEIEVARLLGATDRFIRRPFLYFGGLQGLLGGAAAWGLLGLALTLLRDRIAELSTAYGSEFALTGLSWPDGMALLAISGLLGLLGALFAVAHTQRALRID
ncbi:MAG: ABC transporter permease [Betaproteobacteria bacterium]|nr:ABC transporter permease [Betaproteobacteria bacterium]